MKGLGLRKLFGNATTSFSRQLLSGLLQLIIIAIIARVYGPEGNGLYAIALLLPSMLATFLNLGVSPANVYFISAGKVVVSTAWHTTLKLFLVLSIFGLSIGTSILWWHAEQWLPGVPKTLLWLSLAIFPASLLLGFVSSIFQGLQEFRIFNLVLLTQPSITLLTIGFVLTSGNADIHWLPAAYLIGTITTLLFSLYLLRPFLIKEAVNTEIKNNYGPIVLKYGYKAHLSNILVFINYKADIFLVNFFAGPASAGIYIIAVQLAERLWMLSQAVSTVLLPRLSQLSNKESKRKQITPLISRWVILATSLGSFALAGAAYPIIKLIFGADYLAALTPLFILLPGIVASSGARILANDLAARGRPELNMYTSWVAVIVNLAGNVLLIPEHGLAGAAFATSLCYSTILVLRVIMYSRYTGVAWHQTIFIQISDINSLKLHLAKGPPEH